MDNVEIFMFYGYLNNSCYRRSWWFIFRFEGYLFYHDIIGNLDTTSIELYANARDNIDDST